MSDTYTQPNAVLVADSERPAEACESIDAVMDRYARGDDAAFAELYDLLAPRLIGYLRRITRDPMLVEDLTQATLLQMHRARGTFIRGAAVVPWAFAIARRLAIDEYRRRKHAPPLLLGDEALVSVMTSEASPLARAEGRQIAAVEKALGALPEAQRVAFRLLKVEGLTLAEAAELLGTTEMSVKMRAHRAYEHLRAVIDRTFGGRT